jgi:hypothetical protein
LRHPVRWNNLEYHFRINGEPVMTVIDARRSSALFALALAAAMLAAGSAGAAPGDVDAALPPVSTSAPLPIPTAAKRPIRASARRACTDCWFGIARVPAAQLLQIDNVSCVTTVANNHPTKFFAMSPGVNFSQPLTAIIPPTQLIASGTSNTVLVANVSGPYFFGPGEGVYMFSPGNGLTATCTISGFVFATQ